MGSDFDLVKENLWDDSNSIVKQPGQKNPTPPPSSRNLYSQDTLRLNTLNRVTDNPEKKSRRTPKCLYLFSSSFSGYLFSTVRAERVSPAQSGAETEALTSGFTYRVPSGASLSWRAEGKAVGGHRHCQALVLT